MLFHRHVPADKTDHDRPQKNGTMFAKAQVIVKVQPVSSFPPSRAARQNLDWCSAHRHTSQCYNRIADREAVKLGEGKDDDLQNQGDRRTKQQKSHSIFLDARERRWSCRDSASDEDTNRHKRNYFSHQNLPHPSPRRRLLCRADKFAGPEIEPAEMGGIFLDIII